MSIKHWLLTQCPRWPHYSNIRRKKSKCRPHWPSFISGLLFILIIVENFLSVLIFLSISLKGKERAVEIGTVDQLVALLDSANESLRSKAALALSMWEKKKVFFRSSFIFIECVLEFQSLHLENTAAYVQERYQSFCPCWTIVLLNVWLMHSKWDCRFRLTF